VTLDQIIVYACVVVTVVAGAFVLRYTEIGLKVRAMVDSPAMTDLSGTNPNAISVGVWAVSTFFAGLAGVLAAPIIGLDPDNFTVLIAASFAAVVVAKLRNLPVAVAVGAPHGGGHLPDPALPAANSAWTTTFIDAVPFIVVAVMLIYNLASAADAWESRTGWGGALDRAITPQGESRLAAPEQRTVESASLNVFGKYAGPVLFVAIVGVLPLIVQGYWIGLMAAGVCLRHDFPLVDDRDRRGRHALALPDHLRRCRGPHDCPAGQQSRGAGAGRGSRRRAIALVMGVIVGFLSIRLGDLYVALVTLTFGLLMENLVFTLPTFVNQGLGLTLNRPSFATSDLSFAYLCLACSSSSPSSS
jgi:branched-chain amino acid transport system permease protein